MTENERLDDIKEKLHQWGYLSHHPEAERDLAWLLKLLEERDAHIEGLEERLERHDWSLFLP
jgi:hypothetical protein